MKTLHFLFDQYSQGSLDQKYLPQLKNELTEAYFMHPGELNTDEHLFAEELIIKAYLDQQLPENYLTRFREMVEQDKPLAQKVRLFSELHQSLEKAAYSRMLAASGKSNPEAEKQEEEELQKVLEEVIEKVHSEEKAGSVAEKLHRFRLRLMNFFPAITRETVQPWKLALLTAVIIIAVIAVWITIRPGNEPLITDKGAADTSVKEKILQKDSLADRVNPRVPERPGRLADNESPVRKRTQSREIQLDRTLLACAENIPGQMDYVAVRSASNDAEDLLAQASELYLQKAYDSCLQILDLLIEGQYFKSSDTLDQIRYFNGMLHYSQGIRNHKLHSLETAVMVLSTIGETSRYYTDARWYHALSLVSLDRKQEAKSILESLILLNNSRSAEAKELYDLLKK